MSPPLLRAETLPAPGEQVVLDGPEGRHGAAALRLAPGEVILVGDGRGAVARCEVTETGKATVTARVADVERFSRPSPLVTVVQGLPKSDRSELAVELATEAGADRIVPWQAERCVARWTGPKLERGRAKWLAAARAAAKQSRRPHEPEIETPVDLAGAAGIVAEVVAGGGLALLLHEEATDSLAQVVTGAFRDDAGRRPGEVLLVVGPEGGVAPAELEALAAAGARPVLLGPEVVRTSTAAALTLGALGVLTGRWERLDSDTQPAPAAADDPRE